MTTQAYAGLGIFCQRAFTLEHPDDHVLLLLHEGELVARFSQLGATEQSIQAECARHLALHHHWEGVLWSRSKPLSVKADSYPKGRYGIMKGGGK